MVENRKISTLAAGESRGGSFSSEDDEGPGLRSSPSVSDILNININNSAGN